MNSTHGPLNRIETCPTLIRTFYQKNSHHSIADYINEFPSPEIYLYTWKDATLKELAYTVIRSAKLGDVKTISFHMVLPDFEAGGWIMKPLEEIELSNKAKIYDLTLESYGFQPGYMFDIAYTVF